MPETKIHSPGRLDMSRVALAGHSLGGLTALLGVQQDPRFRAGVILDGVLPEFVAVGTQTPMLVLTAGNDGWGENDCRLWNGLRGPRVAVNLKGAEHVTPSDAVWLARYAIKSGTMGPEKTIAAVRAYVAAFLDANLKGLPAARLLKGSSREYSDAVVTTLGQSPCGQP
jgi:pimeloyl-ACP methyl ester carboxylesterase